MTDQNSVPEDFVESDKIVASGSVTLQPSNERRKLFRRLVALAGLGITGVLLSQPQTGLLPPVHAATMTIDTTNTGTGSTELDSSIASGNAFVVHATGSAGTAIEGAANVDVNSIGVQGDSTPGIGVFGTSFTGVGVEGSVSGAGVGVEGVASASGAAAIFAIVTNAAAIPIIADGHTGQTADLQRWEVAGAVKSAVHADGSLTLGSSSLAIVTPIAAFGQQGAWERDTSDGNGFQFSWVKTRGGAACHANDSIGDLAFDFMNTTPTLVQGAVQRGIVNNPTAGSESTGFQFYCMNSGSMGLRVQITSNGNVLASGFVNTSDMRFKEDITPIENALDKVTRLNGVYFRWNEEYRERLKRSDSEARQVGLVAQQVREVIPEIVAKMRDQEAGDYLAVDYNRLVPVLIQAIKELKVENNALREQLTERIGTLERQIAASVQE